MTRLLYDPLRDVVIFTPMDAVFATCSAVVPYSDSAFQTARNVGAALVDHIDVEISRVTEGLP